MKSYRNRRMVIQKQQVLSFVFIILLLLPYEIFNLTSIYKSSTPYFIRSIRLNYNLDLIQLLILIVGISKTLIDKKYNVFAIGLLLLIREVFVLLIGSESIFSSNAYEIYLVLLTGFSLVVCVEACNRSYAERCNFFKLYLITNIMTIFINVLMQGFSLLKRYNASNLDVGGTGNICAMSILYFSFTYSQTKKHTGLFWCIISWIGLILSGSRANIAWVCLVYALYYIVLIYRDIFKVETRKINKKALSIRLILFFVLIMVFLLFFTDQLSDIISSTLFRMNGISVNNVLSDESLQGRILSITTGWDIIKNHPLGISGFFINLQYEMQIRGYPTFPHSTLMSYYILLGPIILLLYCYLVKTFIKIKKINNPYKWILLYIIISTIVYGSPILNFKIIFHLLFIIRIADLQQYDVDGCN